MTLITRFWLILEDLFVFILSFKKEITTKLFYWSFEYCWSLQAVCLRARSILVSRLHATSNYVPAIFKRQQGRSHLKNRTGSSNALFVMSRF